MITFKIEKGIAIPTVPNQTVYPFSKMKVGDSFAVPLSGEILNAGKNGKWDRTQSRVRSAASIYQRKYGGAFTVRLMKDEGVVRCWRVK